MAITVVSEILGQNLSDFSYCYLYEPLRVKIVEADILATKIYIDVRLTNTENDTIPTTLLEKYVTYDIINASPISIDLMAITRQIHESGVYKMADKDDFFANAFSFETTVSKFKYTFNVYSDTASPTIILSKLPIIGGRIFEQFTADVPNDQALTEFEYYGIDTLEEATLYKDVFTITTTLIDPPTSENADPTIVGTLSNNVAGCKSPEGFLIWKSKFGGWMWHGFDIQTINYDSSYEGNLKVGFFESTEDEAGKSYIPVDYTKVNLSYTRNLKTLGLDSLHLKALSGIKGSPAIYYLEPNKDGANTTYKVELMRLASASAPINSLANGGDFSVTLKSISTIEQNTI